MLNITSSDAPLINSYQQAIKSGNFELAQQLLNQIPQYNQKLLTAEKLNKISQALTAVERFYKTDIIPYTNIKQAEWQNIVNRFSYVGQFNPSNQYELNNFVLYNLSGVNLLFICTQRPPVGTVPTNTSFWRQLTIRGERGPTGDTMAFMFEWDSAQNYSIQDIVTFDNALWSASQVNINQVPYEGSPFWAFIYRASPAIYPVQEEEPIGQINGDLWFQIIGTRP